MEKISLYLIPKEEIEKFKYMLRQFGIRYKEDPKFEIIKIRGRIGYINPFSRYKSILSEYRLYTDNHKGIEIIYTKDHEIIFRLFNELLGEDKNIGPFNRDYILISFYKGTLTIQFP